MRSDATSTLLVGIETIIFDLDGTLYDEERIYDRYAEELARLMGAGPREEFLTHWGELKTGTLPSPVGLGYDIERDLLFSHAGGRPGAYRTWRGPVQDPVPEAEVEGSLFGDMRFNIGDWWGVLSALANTFGLSREQRSLAFRATRAHMATPDGALLPDENLGAVLDRLRERGFTLVAMSNSPVDSVQDSLRQLGVAGHFSAVVADAHKPEGMHTFLAGDRAAHSVLSVGDNYVNDIEPALDAGAAALYIDRHHTGLGSDRARCRHAASHREAWSMLLAG
jgi:FMN phosphatase YigB (HAD superfamily)